MRVAEIVQAYERHYNPALGMLFDVAGCPVEARAQGTHLLDDQGTEYLDFACGYGVFGVGHLNSQVQAAVQRQLWELATSPPLLHCAPTAELLRKLAGLLPGDLKRVFLAGSGSEAIEIALRTVLFARPGRTRWVAARNSYHGKTLGALSVMGQPHLREPFEPLLPDVRFVPYGDAGAMAEAIGSGAAAVFLEPVLGGGYITAPPPGYLAEVRALCDRTGTLLVIDEVQTGFGRTGKLFAIEHDGVLPDILILSKGSTGGHVPLGVAVVRERLMAEIGHAYEADPLAYEADGAGSPLVCAAACAAIDFIVEKDLPRRAAELGAYLQAGLGRAVRAYPTFALEVPGQGLMTGVKLRNNLIEHAVWMQMLKRKVVTGLSTNSQVARPVLRFFPPLTIERHEIDTAVEALLDSLRDLHRVPALLYDLTNELQRIQHHLPRPFLRLGARLLS
jgi:putrescine aminotransferase